MAVEHQADLVQRRLLGDHRRHGDAGRAQHPSMREIILGEAQPAQCVPLRAVGRIERVEVIGGAPPFDGIPQPVHRQGLQQQIVPRRQVRQPAQFRPHPGAPRQNGMGCQVGQDHPPRRRGQLKSKGMNLVGNRNRAVLQAGINRCLRKANGILRRKSPGQSAKQQPVGVGIGIDHRHRPGITPGQDRNEVADHDRWRELERHRLLALRGIHLGAHRLGPQRQAEDLRAHLATADNHRVDAVPDARYSLEENLRQVRRQRAQGLGGQFRKNSQLLRGRKHHQGHDQLRARRVLGQKFRRHLPRHPVEHRVRQRPQHQRYALQHPVHTTGTLIGHIQIPDVQRPETDHHLAADGWIRHPLRIGCRDEHPRLPQRHAHHIHRPPHPGRPGCAGCHLPANVGHARDARIADIATHLHRHIRARQPLIHQPAECRILRLPGLGCSHSLEKQVRAGRLKGVQPVCDHRRQRRRRGGGQEGRVRGRRQCLHLQPHGVRDRSGNRHNIPAKSSHALRGDPQTVQGLSIDGAELRNDLAWILRLVRMRLAKNIHRCGRAVTGAGHPVRSSQRGLVRPGRFHDRNPGIPDAGDVLLEDPLRLLHALDNVLQRLPGHPKPGRSGSRGGGDNVPGCIRVEVGLEFAGIATVVHERFPAIRAGDQDARRPHRDARRSAIHINAKAHDPKRGGRNLPNHLVALVAPTQTTHHVYVPGIPAAQATHPQAPAQFLDRRQFQAAHSQFHSIQLRDPGQSDVIKLHPHILHRPDKHRFACGRKLHSRTQDDADVRRGQQTGQFRLGRSEMDLSLLQLRRQALHEGEAPVVHTEPCHGELG